MWRGAQICKHATDPDIGPSYQPSKAAEAWMKPSGTPEGVHSRNAITENYKYTPQALE